MVKLVLIHDANLHDFKMQICLWCSTSHIVLFVILVLFVVFMLSTPFQLQSRIVLLWMFWSTNLIILDSHNFDTNCFVFCCCHLLFPWYFWCLRQIHLSFRVTSCCRDSCSKISKQKKWLKNGQNLETDNESKKQKLRTKKVWWKSLCCIKKLPFKTQAKWH